MMKKLKNQIEILKERGLWKYSHFLLLKFFKFLKIGFYFSTTSTKIVDIVYVVHEKDFETLNKSIDSLKQIKNITINKIFVISNNTRQVQALIKDHRVTVINDADVLGFTVNQYPYPTQKNLPNRSGWLFQQLIKLGWSLHATSENYIVIDADTYFIRPISFFDNKGRFIFFGSEEWWPPYFDAFHKLFRKKPFAIWSRVSHMMIFNSRCVLNMLREIESIHGMTWHEAIALTRAIDSHSCFSEYETYANWMLINHPQQCTIRPSYNLATSFENTPRNLERIISVSNHSYLKQ